MNRGITVGRIFGIRINIDWSWLLIFALITWNLSALFSQTHPDWTVGAQWGLAAAASILFFLSVLAHELAHALMAIAQGIPVRNITLFLFGGVANIQREPPSPRAEFLITIVGPLTSFVLGGLFLLLGSFALPALTPAMLENPAGLAAQLSPLATILLWLGPINLLLAAFNLIPGFPLDGGRILRSLLWAITDNLRLATRWASWVGQAVAWILILSGIAMIFGLQLPIFGTGLGGLWLVLIGWFLSTAAVQSYRQVVVQDILQDVPVSQLMRRDPPTVPGYTTVAALVHEHVMRSDEHAFPVVEDGRLLGLITLEDVRNISRNQWENTLVRDVMTPAESLTTLSPPKDASEALQKLQQRDVRQLPVMENGQLAGLLRRRDILKWLQLQGAE